MGDLGTDRGGGSFTLLLGWAAAAGTLGLMAHLHGMPLSASAAVSVAALVLVATMFKGASAHARPSSRPSSGCAAQSLLQVVCEPHRPHQLSHRLHHTAQAAAPHHTALHTAQQHSRPKFSASLHPSGAAYGRAPASSHRPRSLRTYTSSNPGPGVDSYLDALGSTKPAQTIDPSPNTVPSTADRAAADTDDFDRGVVMDGSIKFERKAGSEQTTPDTNPLLVFVPGLDFSGMTITLQQELFVSKFETWVMSGDASDRSSFEQLQASLIGFLQSHRSLHPDREVIVMGESFGGLLSLATYLRSRRQSLSESDGDDTGTTTSAGVRPLFSRLVLLNPATGYDKTAWPLVAPLLERVPKEVYPALAGALLTLTAADSYQVAKVTTSLISNPTIAPELIGKFMELCRAVPPDTLGYRLKHWLSNSRAVSSQLHDVDIPVLLVCGGNDRLLNSSSELRRLSKELPMVDAFLYEGVGHAVLDDRYSMVDRITSWLDSLRPGGDDLVTSYVRPTPEQVRLAESTTGAVPIAAGMTLNGLRESVSPVFFSTAHDGRVVRGLGALPRYDQRPVLFVGNHQLYAMDLGLLIQQFLNERDEVIRGLSHPAVWEGGSGLSRSKVTRVTSDGVQVDPNVFKAFGAVPNSGINLYKLMQAGQHALLFPGGVKEAYHKRGEQYTLMWPDRAEFVRTCAKFDAIIVPFGGVGAYDSVNWVADSEQIKQTPVIGPLIREQTAKVPLVRGDEVFVPPLALPKPEGPDRFYFMFGQPIDTRELSSTDRDGAQIMYEQTQREVQGCINVLLDARERDPYRDPLRRRVREKVTGAQAPTFDVSNMRMPFQS